MNNPWGQSGQQIPIQNQFGGQSNMQQGQSGLCGNSMINSGMNQTSIPSRPGMMSQQMQRPMQQMSQSGQTIRPINQANINKTVQAGQNAIPKEIDMGFNSFKAISNGTSAVSPYGDTYQININNIPDKAFINANKFIDIAIARIVNHKNYANYHINPGEPDVMLIFKSGEMKRITRNELCSEYRLPSTTHPNGKKIKPIQTLTDVDFYVYRESNIPYKAIYIPSKYVVQTSRGMTPCGFYLVCPVKSDGTADKTRITMVKKNDFHKMFAIPPQAGVITGRKRNNIPEQAKQAFNSNIVSQISKNEPGQMQKPMQKPVQQTQINSTPSENKYKYTVVGQLKDITGNRKGFIVKSLSSGATKKITEKQLIFACDQHLVNNVSSVVANSGEKFLRGNGISINSLPITII